MSEAMSRNDWDLDTAGAAVIAAALQVLATPSRLLILARLRRGDCTVLELARSVRMERSAVSHQLRLLRVHGLVSNARQGRTVRYRLCDHHVARMLDNAVEHLDHLRVDVDGPTPDAEVRETGR